MSGCQMPSSLASFPMIACTCVVNDLFPCCLRVNVFYFLSISDHHHGDDNNDKNNNDNEKEQKLYLTPERCPWEWSSPCPWHTCLSGHLSQSLHAAHKRNLHCSSAIKPLHSFISFCAYQVCAVLSSSLHELPV